MTIVRVELGERSYPIHIGQGTLTTPRALHTLLQNALSLQKVTIITNDVIAPLYLDACQRSLAADSVNTIIVPDGEANKSLEWFANIQTALLEQHAARDTLIIALGGGVIGDLTGFAAACYQRGVPFVQIPTTLLSQVDSSVGGKTAVNHPLGKNMIGAFYQPQAVVIDTDTLHTLPAREFAAGMAEVIKYGIIYDADFFAWLEQNIDALQSKHTDALVYAIKRCCEIKAEIVANDEREQGQRALLNLGHTFGHAIEAEQGYGEWLHGEAVAAGMVIACQVAEQKAWLSASETRRVSTLLAQFNLPVEGPVDMSSDDYIRHMRHDKKVLRGKIRFILPKSIGQAVVTDDVDDTLLANVLG
ncbi:3-dehydroquinate synthase [Aestuariibacter salexigens]|uniref:3-dehydroquinate synthase n=1 Tax=Aestuariibacter salexigens TaxID=226010 RepID=UPI000424E1E6|nr:3-dehydroquinate synthase [Aestuariibacter salexigens]